MSGCCYKVDDAINELVVVFVGMGHNGPTPIEVDNVSLDERVKNGSLLLVGQRVCEFKIKEPHKIVAGQPNRKSENGRFDCFTKKQNNRRAK